MLLRCGATDRDEPFSGRDVPFGGRDTPLGARDVPEPGRAVPVNLEAGFAAVATDFKSFLGSSFGVLLITLCWILPTCPIVDWAFWPRAMISAKEPFFGGPALTGGAGLAAAAAGAGLAGLVPLAGLEASFVTEDVAEGRETSAGRDAEVPL